MLFSFTLSMPNRGSWNGRWSGEERLYAIVRNLSNAKKYSNRNSNLQGSYYYNFGDGWGASIAVQQITPSEARTIRRKSNGFCGYEWMIDSIIRDGEILINPRATVAGVEVKGGEKV